MTVRNIVGCLVLFLAVNELLAVDITPHPGRRDASTPGIVLETGARTAACDAMFFTQDGSFLLAAGDDKVVRSWAVSANELSSDGQPTIRWPIFREVRGNIYAAALSPDQKLVAFGGNGRTSGGFAVAVSERSSGQLLYGSDSPPNANGQQGAVWAIAFSPSGKRVAIGTDRGSVWVWDLADKSFIQVGKHEAPPGQDGWYSTVRLVAFTGEETVLSVCGNSELASWSMKEPLKKRLIHQFSGPIATPAIMSPDRRWIGAVIEARPGEKEAAVELVSFPNAEAKRRIPYPSRDDSHHAIPHRLAFDADSSQLAVGVRLVGNRFFDKSVKMFQERGGRVDLYDLKAETLTARPGPKQSLYAESLAFHPQRKNVLAIAGGDNHDVALWDLKSNEKIAEVRQPGRSIWGIALSPDGQTLGYQTARNPEPTHPNSRGIGPWVGFQLPETKLLRTLPFEPKPNAPSSTGWEVMTSAENGEPLQFWKLKKDGQINEIPWSRTEDEFPRCYAFIPGTKTRPERLIIGHYWGASVFELQGDEPKRIRSLRGHEGYVSALAVSADGERVVTASRDMTIAGWTLSDWPNQPRLGAEIFIRNDRLFVGQISAGSPIWELGLEPGDEILSLRVPDPKQPGAGKVIYDRAEAQPTGTAKELLEYFKDQLTPGQEHVFYWKRPEQATIYGAITTLLDRPLWRFFPDVEQDWVLWQWRDYRYAASAGGDRSIGWQTSFPFQQLRTPSFVSAAQLRKEFNKADVVRGTLSNWQNDQALVQFNQMQPPQVMVSEPTFGPLGYEVTVTVTPDGILETQQPERLLIWVNDHILLDERLDTKSGEKVVRKLQLKGSVLREGVNVISSQCYARSGARGDARPQLLDYRPASYPPRVLRALVVGVSDYTRSNPPQVPLAAAEDAKVLERALLAQKGKGVFSDVQVKVLLDRQATRTAVIEYFEELIQKGQVHPNDQFVIYLGGHGTSREQLSKKVPENQLQGLGRYLFLCGDVNVQKLPSTTISFEDIQSRLAKLPCHKLVLLDSCHSGEAQITGGNHAANPIRVLTEHGVGPVILAASAYDQQAIESYSLDTLGGARGLFTIAVRTILEERPSFLAADKNRDNVLTTEEFANAVQVQMKLLLDRHNAFLRRLGQKEDVQTPTKFLPHLEARIHLAGK
jgi:WD40 repeat protein